MDILTQFFKKLGEQKKYKGKVIDMAEINGVWIMKKK